MLIASIFWICQIFMLRALKGGATVRSRTADILITSEVLYQLSYGGPKVFEFERVIWLFFLIVSTIYFVS